MANEPSERPHDVVQGRASWDHPKAMGWQVWRRAHNTGLLTSRMQRNPTSANSRTLGDRVPLASLIQRRWGKNFGLAGHWPPLSFPLRRSYDPSFDSGHSAEPLQLTSLSTSSSLSPSPSSSPSVQKLVSAPPPLSRSPNSTFVEVPRLQRKTTARTEDYGTKLSSSTGKFTRSSVMTGAYKNYPEVLSQSPKDLVLARSQQSASVFSPLQQSSLHNPGLRHPHGSDVAISEGRTSTQVPVRRLPLHSQAPRIPHNPTQTINDRITSTQALIERRVDVKQQSQRDPAHPMLSTSPLAMQSRGEEATSPSVPSASQLTGYEGSVFRGPNMPVYHAGVLQRQKDTQSGEAHNGTPLRIGSREEGSTSVLRNINVVQASQVVPMTGTGRSITQSNDASSVQRQIDIPPRDTRSPFVKAAVGFPLLTKPIPGLVKREGQRRSSQAVHEMYASPAAQFRAPLTTLRRSIFDSPAPLVSPRSWTEPASAAIVQRSQLATHSQGQEAKAAPPSLTRVESPTVIHRHSGDPPLVAKGRSTTGQASSAIPVGQAVSGTPALSSSPRATDGAPIPFISNTNPTLPVSQTTATALPLVHMVHRAVTGYHSAAKSSEQKPLLAPWRGDQKLPARASAEARGGTPTSTVVAGSVSAHSYTVAAFSYAGLC